MEHHVLALAAAAVLLAPSAALAVHIPDPSPVTHFEARFAEPFGTPVYWDYGAGELTQTFLVSNVADVVVRAETFPTAAPDAPKTCIAPAHVETGALALAAHLDGCTKPNGHGVALHRFPCVAEFGADCDVVGPTPATPTAMLAWGLDVVPDGAKTMVLSPGRWLVAVDPLLAPGPHDIQVTMDAARPFSVQPLGPLRCPLQSYLDEALLGC